MTKSLIVANWKMNNAVPESLLWVAGFQRHMKVAPSVEVAIAPPFTSLYSVGIAIADSGISLAAQDIFWEDKGAFTGEVSGSFLRDVGCEYVIIGHSERRQYFGETNDNVNKKIAAALRNDLIPIMCVGESLSQREAGKTHEVLERQLKDGITAIPQKDLERLVIAYEPIWAIGTGKNATPEEAEESHHFIRNYIAKFLDAPTANNIRIIYGGSVKASNCDEILKQPNVDGALVGGASLDPRGFSDIVAQAIHKER